MQGDELLVHQALIDSLIECQKNSDFKGLVEFLPVGNHQPRDLNTAKFAYDDNFRIIYASRSLIPNGPDGYRNSVRIFGLISLDY